MSFQYIKPGRKSPEHIDLPPYKTNQYQSPEHYLIQPDLASAIDVALVMNQPLLITGEPGTGKTRLAARIAWELGLHGPLVFHTKSTSISTDLFYSYNALARFHVAQASQKLVHGANFIQYNALGQAILLSKTADAIKEIDETFKTRLILDSKNPLLTQQKRSIVLIDEIDKAPRDFPNDLLNEIEHCSFTIPELNNAHIQADADHYPVIIITSNSEKHLPDPFLRRCVYYHIEFPKFDDLKAIVSNRLHDMSLEESFLQDALKLFYELRDDRHGIKKKPATAELLVWLVVLRKKSSAQNPITDDKQTVSDTLFSTLIKNKTDLVIAKKVVEQWRLKK
jgi:MoxR-like ATPase